VRWRGGPRIIHENAKQYAVGFSSARDHFRHGSFIYKSNADRITNIPCRYVRSNLKPARPSSEKIFGCSQAAGKMLTATGMETFLRTGILSNAR
jgi:hypothetical protein